MTETPRPWWASETREHAEPGEPQCRIDEVDPIEAFRSARRPRPVPPRAAQSAPTSGAPPSPGATPSAGAPTSGSRSPLDDHGVASEAARDGGDPGPHRPELCGICPLCTLARTLEDTRPELMEHLTEAARHLAAAARSLLETPPPAPQGARGAEQQERPPRSTPGRGGVQRIPLERRGDEGTGSGPGGDR